MLKSIRLQNFFGFQDCTINLEKGANVLVGINGSGKSNFFKAIRLLKSLLRDNDLREIIYKEFGGLENILFSDNNKDPFRGFSIDSNFDFLPYRNVEYGIGIMSDFNGRHMIERENYTVRDTTNNLLYYDIDRNTTHVKVQELQQSGVLSELDSFQIETTNSILGKGIFENNVNSTYLFSQVIQSCKVYLGFDTTRSSVLRQPNSPSIGKSLSDDSSNIASLLNDIKLADKETYNRIVNALKKVSDKFIGIEFKQLSGFIELWLEEDGLNRAVSPIHISDGTLKFLCLMAILYNPNRGSVVCIDEPELGLHPDMIHTLFEAIEFASQTSQVIISTHSADLLDYFELKQIRVFEKDEHNATTVKQFGEKEFEGWYEKFYPGEMWRAGNIGGNRW
jgi:predicted ATPase